MILSRRAVVRLITFAIAIVAVLGFNAYDNNRKVEELTRTIHYSYQRAIEDLATSVDNIQTTLSKGMYASSPEMMSDLSVKLWADSNAAKTTLSQLPIGELNLESTYKFLSQVGDYSQSLSKKVADGDELTDEEKENVKKLHGYSEKLSEDMWEMQSQMQQGLISFDTAKSLMNNAKENQPDVKDGFKGFEDQFESYPTLIYDGPFSDHILQKKPELTKGKENVSREKALDKALKATGLKTLEDDEDEGGKMPSYSFKGENTNVSVTKKGGLLSYMIKSREVLEENISTKEAKKKAEEYLKHLGIENMKSTYHETLYNSCTINFAAMDGDVTLYTDLIKVTVALDNGEILGFDARGYIVNHHERDLEKPKISGQEAREKVSPTLEIKDSKLALIPTQGLNEKLTYEFKCTDKEGKNILVYINAMDGKEEQILILIISEDGMLTV